MSDGTAPRGDADLNWLQMRASETARVASELLAEAQRLVDIPLGNPDRKAIMSLFAELSAAQKVALESKQALEDAYEAQAILLPPAPVSRRSPEENAAWIRLLEEQNQDAIIRLLRADEKVRTLRADSRAEKDIESLNLDEHAAETERLAQLIEALDEATAARKDFGDTSAAIERAHAESEDEPPAA